MVVFLFYRQYQGHTQMELKWLLIVLTCTFVPFRVLGDFRAGQSVHSDGPVRDPWLVHTPLHPPHDEVQQDVHSLAHILPVGSTCLKVWDTGQKKTSGSQTDATNYNETHLYGLTEKEKEYKKVKGRVIPWLSTFNKNYLSRWNCSKLFCFSNYTVVLQNNIYNIIHIKKYT